MAQTIQSVSSTFVEEPKTEDNISLMFSACESLNNLYITLEKLYHAMKMKNIELQIKLKEKEKRLLLKATSPHSGAVQLTSPLKRLKKEEKK